MPLGKDVGLSTGHIVLDGDPVGTQLPIAAPPHFRPCLFGQTAAHLGNCWALVRVCDLKEWLQIAEVMFFVTEGRPSRQHSIARIHVIANLVLIVICNYTVNHKNVTFYFW